MSKLVAAERTRTGSPKPPAGPGDLSEEKPAPQPTRKDEPKAPPPAGPGKFPEPGDIAPRDHRATYAHAQQFVGTKAMLVGHLSDAQLDALAEITPEDVERALQRCEWSAEVRDLLDAVPEEDAMAYDEGDAMNDDREQMRQLREALEGTAQGRRHAHGPGSGPHRIAAV